ncbi:MAG: CoA transferase [Cytophagaceae bacterium]|nr:CoA transferase [Cytophagaceae bacterium]
MKNLPLHGLRILDLTRLLPGPLGTMLLADWGAEVIKIEHPDQPDPVRAFPPYLGGESANYLAFNRNKRSLLLDYTSDEGRALFLKLIKTADVVVEQFRPGFLDKLGLGYAAAQAVNERIIYVSVTGYGQTGPYAHRAGHDLNYVGLAGVLGLTGPADGPPDVPGVQLADIAGGSYLLGMATLAALFARQQSGQGQHVDVAMTDAVMPLLAVPYTQYAATGQVPRRGTLPLSGGLAHYGVYACAEGGYVALGTLEPKFWQRFCENVEKPEWMACMQPENAEDLARFKIEIAALFATKTRDVWTAFGQQHDLPLTPVLDLNELENDPQIQTRGMIQTVGGLKQIAAPLKFSASEAPVFRPAPKLGADTEAILRELAGW